MKTLHSTWRQLFGVMSYQHHKKWLSYATSLVMSAALVSIPMSTVKAAALTQTLQGNGVQLGAFGDSFGSHILSTNNWLMIGAPRDSVDLNGDGEIGPGERLVGSVYIYKRTANGPVLHQKLSGKGLNQGGGDRFGSGLTLLNGHLFIGVANEGNNQFFQGRLHIYSYKANQDKWEKEKQELTSDMPIDNGAYGSRTDANHTVGFDNHGVLVVAESGNDGPGPATGKLHVYKQANNKNWMKIQTVQSPRVAEIGSASTFGDTMIKAGNNHLLVSDQHSGDDISGNLQANLVVYKVNSNGIIAQPVQTIAEVNSRPNLSVPQPQEEIVFNYFGLPTAFLGVFSKDAISWCRDIVTGAGSFDGIAAAGNLVVIADPCYMQSDDWRKIYGKVDVYTFDANAATPLTLKESLVGPSDQLSYGMSLFGADHQIATDGQRALVGSPQIVDYPENFPGVQVPGVDVYTMVNGRMQLTDTIVSPEINSPLEIAGLFGKNIHLPAGSANEALISRFGAFTGAGGRVYIYDLSQ